MKKVILTIALLIAIGGISQAQSSFKDKSFHAMGFSIYTDFIRGPIKDYNYTDGSGEAKTGAIQYSGFSLFTYMYRFRYNLLESSDNFAVSLSASPAIGVSIFSGSESNSSDDGGFAHLNIPIMAGLEFGAGSTYNSTANMGGHFGFGIEYTAAPLFGGGTVDVYDNNGSTIKVEATTSWMQPVLDAGVRYWNKKNKLREINIKYGFGSYSTNANDGTLSDISENSMSIRLSWLLFLNY